MGGGGPLSRLDVLNDKFGFYIMLGFYMILVKARASIIVTRGLT